MTHPSTTDATPRDLERRLVAYAVTAGATLVAATQDASAAPVTLTQNLDIPVGVVNVPLDVDGDGVDDFFFNNVNVDANGGYLSALGAGANGFLGVTNKGLAFPKGSYQWGPEESQDAVINSGILAAANDTEGGLFLPFLIGLPSDLYYPLPLVFDIGGNTHFGWARIRAQFAGPGTLDVDILDTGWESEPNADVHFPDPTAVPEPGALGLLALGAAGLALRRRLARHTTD
jgi:hypothetical protein